MGIARLVAAFVLALTGVVLVVDAPAFACRCRVQGLEDQVARADAVFVGQVDDVTSIRGGQAFDYTVTAETAYKGQVDTEVMITSAAKSSACGLGRLDTGRDYVFFVDGQAPPYSSDTCSGTGPATADKVDRVEGLLGPGDPVEPPAPRTATRTLVEESPPPEFTRLAAPGAAMVLVGLLGLVVVRRLARR